MARFSPDFAWRYLKHLYLPGLALLVAGLGAGLATGQWPLLYQGILGAGLALLLVWLLAAILISPNFSARRSARVGANVTVTTLAALVIVAAVNLLALRYAYTVDLTENQRFTLSPQTQTLVTQLEKPVKIWIFDSQPSEGDRALLQNYQRLNGQLTYEFVDPDQNPALVQRFGVKAQGEVFAESGEKKQQVQTLINFQQREPLSESKLTNTLEKLRRDRPLQAYFLQGHGEAPLSTAKEGLSEAVGALENKGFKINPLNLVETRAIPPETNVVIVAGPQRPLLPAEVQSLQTYSNQGGSVLVMVSPEVDPGLDPFLKPWGARLDPRIAVDLSGAGAVVGLGPAALLVNRYGEHLITQDFAQGLTILPLSRPVATTPVPNVQAVTLLEASEKMAAKRELTEDLAALDPKQDLQGPFDLAVALERASSTPLANPTPSPHSSPSPLPSPSPLSSPKPAKLVLIGNSLFASNEWFNEQLNGDLFLNSVQWLASDDREPLSIRPKDPANRRLNLTPLQASLLGWLSWVIIPLGGLILAVSAWWRRR
ncbi:MAG: ABC transporter [Cyanobacteria bacterium RI_101]|nr:ABC transporter [Cyanobacteria bacterium RI_101]